MNFEKDWIIKTKVSDRIVNSILSDINNAIISNNLISNISGKSAIFNSEQYDLDNFLTKDSSIQEIKKLVKKSLLKSKIINDNARLINMSKWTVIGNKGCYHVVHKHNLLRSYDNYCVSTVTYLRVPEQLDNDDRSGNFYAFFRENRIVTLSPKVGDVFIFPVWLYHGTYPQNEGIRQTINLDFRIS